MRDDDNCDESDVDDDDDDDDDDDFPTRLPALRHRLLSSPGWRSPGWPGLSGWRFHLLSDKAKIFKTSTIELPPNDETLFVHFH